VNEKAVARVGRQCHKEKENYIFDTFLLTTI